MSLGNLNRYHIVAKTKTAILISGRGTNMSALIAASKTDDYPAEIDLVISNRPDAEGLKVAKSRDIKAVALDHKLFKSRRSFDKALHELLKEHNIEFVVCAGFMRILGKEIVRNWSGRMINIHPSLLPKYKGLDTHQRAIDARDKKHGCTVHWVSEGVDDGEIIAQAELEINGGDTADSLAKRVQALEHALYPLAFKQVLTGF